MSGLVSKVMDDWLGINPPAAPIIVPPKPPAPPPSVADAEQAVRDRELADADARRRRKGRAATILTGDSGAGLPTTAAKTLLGE